MFIDPILIIHFAELLRAFRFFTCILVDGVLFLNQHFHSISLLKKQRFILDKTGKTVPHSTICACMYVCIYIHTHTHTQEEKEPIPIGKHVNSIFHIDILFLYYQI